MADLPENPWDFQQIPGHDLLVVFQKAWREVNPYGPGADETLRAGLLAVLRCLAWEMDNMPLPKDAPDQRTMLIQHVLHRVGDQGNGI